MPVFAYKATDDKGRVVDGQIEARDPAAVADRLQRLSFYPLEIRASEEAKEAGRLAPGLGWRRGRKVSFFTAQLATLLEAGLPVDRSLAIVEDLTEDRRLAAAIGRVRASVERGSTLSEAMRSEGVWFNDLYVNMVRAGESGGVLEIVLRRLADFLEESRRIKDFVASSLAYPVFLVFFSAVSLAFIFITVLPRFAQIFSDMGEAIPLPARVLMEVSGFMGRWWWAVLAALAGLILAARAWIGTREGRLRWDRARLGWPLIGGVLLKLETARLSRTLGTLMAGGVPVLAAVDIVGETVGNRHLASFMGGIKNGLRKGEGLVAPLRRAGVFPPLFLHLASIGEETGRLEDMLNKVASVYELEVETATKGLLSILEPLILLVLGVVLGGIIITVLWAIFSVYSISF